MTRQMTERKGMNETMSCGVSCAKTQLKRFSLICLSLQSRLLKLIFIFDSQLVNKMQMTTTGDDREDC